MPTPHMSEPRMRLRRSHTCLLSMLHVQVGQLLGPLQAQAAALWRITPGQEAFCIPSAHAFLSAVLDSSIAALRPPGQQTQQPKGNPPLTACKCTPLCMSWLLCWLPLASRRWGEERVKQVSLPDKGCMAQSTRLSCWRRRGHCAVCCAHVLCMLVGGPCSLDVRCRAADSVAHRPMHRVNLAHSGIAREQPCPKSLASTPLHVCHVVPAEPPPASFSQQRMACPT